MVRVLMCHSFRQQKVFSDAYEPTSISCSVSQDLVFVTTMSGDVFIYSLLENGFPLVHQFPLVSPAKELIFSNVGNYVLTREVTRKDKPNYCTARVYFNWSKWRASKPKIKMHQVGGASEPSSETVTAVEVQSRFSVCALCCCPITGNIAVATEAAVSLYKACVDGPVDLQRLYVVEPGFCIQKLAICEKFLAFTSTSEVRVLRVDGQSLCEESLTNQGLKSETEQLLSMCVLSNSVTQREVFDEEFVIWSFDQCLESSSEQSFSDIFASNEWNDGYPGSNRTPCVVELPLIKEEVPYIDYSEKSYEVLGPVKVVHGHPLKVQAAWSIVRHVTMLYRYFEADSAKNDGELMLVPEIHTLQLIPFYTSDNNENDAKSSSPGLEISPTLSGMMCLVSSPKEGFIYDIFTKTELLSHCTYTSDTKTATIAENLLYAVTSQAVETYVIPIYAAMAKHARANRPPDFSDKLQIVDPLETNFDCGAGGLQGEDSDGFIGVSAGSCTKDTDDGLEDLDQKSYNYFGYPVYDIDILRKPCPSPCSDLYLIGVHQFPCVYSILTAGKRVVMLSDTTINTPPKHHSKKGKTRKSSKTKDWTLHALQAMDMETLYNRMEALMEKSGNVNAQADLRLLKEQHMILRTQFQVGCNSKRNSLLRSLRNSVKNLGNYYASYAVDDVEEVMLYYAMADISTENVVDQHIQGCVEIDKIKEVGRFGKGLVFYLNEVLFQKNQEKCGICFPQVAADKILYIYCNADPTRLSTLIIRPLVEGYTPELAVKLLMKLKKTKSYSFSTEDHLALTIVYLKICAIEHAGEELLNLPKVNLADICVKHHYILYEKDETMSPLGQLLRKRLPKVFIKTLVSLHSRGILSLTNTVQLLQGKECEKHQNTHLLEYLELVLNDQKGKKSFKEARKLLIEIYLEQLSRGNTAQLRRDVLRLPHYHIPKGSGHFSKRFRWLDKLPPFNGCVSEPIHCPFLKANISAASPPRGNWLPGFSRTRVPKLAVDDTQLKSSCTCCCCWETLLKLQSILCSRYCDKELGKFVLSNLVGRTLPGCISITLLCLPLVGEHEKAVESLLAAEPSSVLTYSKQFFGDSHVKWQCVLNVLTEQIRNGSHSDTTYNKYKEILQETLVILSKCTTPNVFLSLLPDDGNFAFFLPFLLQCCQKNAATNLSNQITAR